MQREVTTHHMPDLPDRKNLEADYVWAMRLVVLHHEAQQLLVKECDYPTMAACTARHNDERSCRLLRINPSSNLGPLQESQVNVFLIHTAQRRLKAAIVVILDVVGTKMDDLQFLSASPPLPCIPLVKTRTPTNALPLAVSFCLTRPTQLWIFPV